MQSDAGSPAVPPAVFACPCPGGFRSFVANAGVKDASLDFAVVVADAPCAAAGVFTLSRFSGPAVQVSRDHLADGRAQAIVVVSKNANVATGADGLADVHALGARVASVVGVAPTDIVHAATGVIGRRLPMERLLVAADGAADRLVAFDGPAVAEAIMTTDTVAKFASATCGAAVIVGVAKGVGMIEPDMATLLAFFVTDAEVAPGDLDRILRSVVGRTFNCLSIDTDTSTSDSCVVLASGTAGIVDLDAFEAALEAVALSLVMAIARDGEGATKLIEVTVDAAATSSQAKEVAKLIVNSPLVKTAVHGSDPNWGRVAMAIGKAQRHADIDPGRVVIRFGAFEVYPTPLGDLGLATVGDLMKADEVSIHVSLNTGSEAVTVWGCDLSDGYVRINADYTT